MILGVTGTRHPITPLQRLWLHTQLAEGVDELHQGGCVNADHEAHKTAIQHEVPVVVHPPTDKKLAVPLDQLQGPGVTILADRPYHDRNRDIVHASDKLIGLPDGPKRPHSGTWYTISYALGAVDQQLSKGRTIPVTVCYPDGTTETLTNYCVGCGTNCDGECGLW